MNGTNVAFVKDLAGRFSGLAELLKEHARDNSGEILPHVFFGDLTRYVLSLHTAAAGAGESGSRRELREILNLLEGAFSAGDPSLQELIAVSFLENLPDPGEDGSQIRSLLGKALSAELSRMG